MSRSPLAPKKKTASSIGASWAVALRQGTVTRPMVADALKNARKQGAKEKLAGYQAARSKQRRDSKGRFA